MNIRNITDIMNNEALEYAMYTISSRAIPNLIDGLKPSQRFFLYSAIQMCKGDKFQKVAAIGGRVAEWGYHHGENSASDAGQMMANTWNNNIAILQGDGDFGSRLVQKAAATRYTFCKPSTNFAEIYKDNKICPKHSDIEHIPPAHYLPIIPMVLANGVRGIATGYATTIFPHSKKSLIECTLKAIKGELNHDPEIQFPEFNGVIETIDNSQILVKGTYELISKTKLVINEVPVKYDYESYIKVLDGLEDKGKIVGYEDQCGECGFQFTVTLKRDYESSNENIMKDFGLIQKMSQNITTIDEQGKLKIFENTMDLVNHFVKVRMRFVNQRISYNKAEAFKKANLAQAKALFIQKVINEEIIVKGVTKKNLITSLSIYPIFIGKEDQLVSMSVYHMTLDEVEKLRKEMLELQKEYDYWCTTTAEHEYKKDLKKLLKSCQ